MIHGTPIFTPRLVIEIHGTIHGIAPGIAHIMAVITEWGTPLIFGTIIIGVVGVIMMGTIKIPIMGPDGQIVPMVLVAVAQAVC
jgi:hypothetical protein